MSVQAKDLPGDALVAAVAEVQATTGRWAHLEDLVAAFPEMPAKVVLAKARKLVRSGAITGCACGCRGDFEVVFDPAAAAVVFGYGVEEPGCVAAHGPMIRARENRLTATQTAGAMLLIGLLSDTNEDDDEDDQTALAADKETQV